MVLQESSGKTRIRLNDFSLEAMCRSASHSYNNSNKLGGPPTL